MSAHLRFCFRLVFNDFFGFDLISKENKKQHLIIFNTSTQVLQEYTEFYYDWSFILGWLGVFTSLGASFLFFFGSCCLDNEKEKEQLNNVQYIMPGLYDNWYFFRILGAPAQHPSQLWLELHGSMGWRRVVFGGSHFILRSRHVPARGKGTRRSYQHAVFNAW